MLSAGRDHLPAGIALRHIRVIARGIGAVIPSLRGVGLAIVIIAIVWIITPPGVCERSTEEKPAIMETIVIEPAIVKSIPLEPLPVKSGKSAAVERAPATVETAAPATMRPGKGEVWLADCGSAHHESCDSQSPSQPGPGSVFT